MATGRLLLAVALSLALAPPPLAAAERKPEEYTPEEFPAWARKLRRGETVLFGSLPFSLFVVTLGFDGIRYLTHVSEGDASRYAPWPFRAANPVPYTREESIGVGVCIVAGSLVVALADFVIGEIRERRAPAP